MARAIAAKSTSSPMRTSLAWTFSMASRPARSGSSTGMRRSKRPGRSSAGSSDSGRFVAARYHDALRRVEAVHLGQQLVEGLLALVVAAVAAAVALFAYRVYLVDEDDAGRLLVRLLEEGRAPSPRPCRRTSRTNSLPDIEKKGTCASPATARASRVLPVPGGPTSSAPLGSFGAYLGVFARLVQEVDYLLERLPWPRPGRRRPRR